MKVRVSCHIMFQQIKSQVLAESLLPDHKQSDAFVFVLMSHGVTGKILTSDGYTVDIMKDIITPFDGEKCPALLGKPKIFLIQACRKEPKSKCLMGDTFNF